MSGCVTFHFRNGLAEHFIDPDKKRRSEWQGEWTYLCFPEPDAVLAEPTAVVERHGG